MRTSGKVKRICACSTVFYRAKVVPRRFLGKEVRIRNNYRTIPKLAQSDDGNFDRWEKTGFSFTRPPNRMRNEGYAAEEPLCEICAALSRIPHTAWA
jgi:hypothetical protein